MGVALLLAGSVTWTQAQAVLRVAMAPETTPAEQATRFEPLGQFLEARFKMRVKWVPVASEAFAVRALLNREADLVWLNGLSYVQASVRAKDQVVPLVQREEDQKARSVFIARAAAGSLKKLQDLKGLTLSLGPTASTAENLMPRSALLAAKLKPETDLKLTSAANAEAVVAAVVSGKAQAGALGLETWERMVADKQVDPAAVKVVFTTPVYTDHTWVVLADLPEGTRKAIAGGMLVLEAVKGGRDVLKSQRAHRFTETKDVGYASVRAAAEQTEQLR
jgi:phosphonate transport system substrate-binding protein